MTDAAARRTRAGRGIHLHPVAEPVEAAHPSRAFDRLKDRTSALTKESE
ncbi:hypothetical protein [Microbacterium hibisci]|nr:hypothetical protein [Microbacterium hibisci]